MAKPAFPDDQSFPPWLATRWIGVVLELVPGVAVAVVWLGSRTEAVHYHDFWGLHLLALIPPLGWIWRGLMGCSVAPVVWSARLFLIILAAILWAYSGGHSLVMIDDCCVEPREAIPLRMASIVGMHASLLACIAVSLWSAYGVAAARPRILDLTS